MSLRAKRLRLERDLARYILARIPDLRREGKHFRGSCPMHTDRKRSLVVSTRRRLWRCFSGDHGGDFVSFIAQLYGLSRAQVAAALPVSARRAPRARGRHARRRRRNDDSD